MGTISNLILNYGVLCRWFWQQSQHWMRRMAPTRRLCQSTLNENIGTCRQATQTFSPTTSTEWRVQESYSSGKTTTWKQIPMHLPGVAVAGLLSLKFHCHQALLCPLLDPGPSTKGPKCTPKACTYWKWKAKREAKKNSTVHGANEWDYHCNCTPIVAMAEDPRDRPPKERPASVIGLNVQN